MRLRFTDAPVDRPTLLHFTVVLSLKASMMRGSKTYVRLSVGLSSIYSPNFSKGRESKMCLEYTISLVN
jgi:hypothetical protein